MTNTKRYIHAFMVANSIRGLYRLFGFRPTTPIVDPFNLDPESIYFISTDKGSTKHL